ncbi:PREDICTED: uncharacterized protein LOC108761073 [Trachymyrmex cornetzi]|uniref:uncharacterized protein LOC108761073 n=1 Tax=Trachymyrmex cornetzi TaxID=471704 RepID=UPI00084F2D01|nr:PREDICTED: uncharacterized protein LOC108761073 [Trachymyrmex cornetzi]
MAEETENLILAQEYKIDALKRVLINYKKLPKASVTVPTIQSRISQLKELWAACVARSRVVLTLKPCSSAEPAFPLHAYVFQNITSYAASRTQPIESWPHLQGISFADPDPSSRHRIHLLIGANLYGSLLKNGLRQGPIGTPTAQLTALGWIISGPTGRGRIESENVCVCHNVSTHDTNSLLRQFWEDEEVSRPPPLTDEEERCEQHFFATHSRFPEGRYIVRLPFRHELPIDIGDSLPIATIFYEKMERKLSRHAELSAQYNDFLAEYLALGHMSAIESPCDTALTPVYIPHHSVLRETSSTTKLRVVFNASCKTTNGTSLNDHLLVGPKLQQDLPAILLRWRQWRFVYAADIAKMFRQILVNNLDTDFQRILWRPSCNTPIMHFRLLTVTYGLAPAPYLAMRVLKQLSLDEGSDYPAAVPILRDSAYVDDALFGEDDVASLMECREQLTGLLQRRGFQLRKWASNSPELLRDLATRQTDMEDHLLQQDETLKELWLTQSDWDIPLSDELRQQWEAYYNNLETLNGIRIPRWTGRQGNDVAFELHGFADASNRAYAAVVYIRILLMHADVQVYLLAAKTKVAPLKTLSIPRLELNAIVLLSRLIKWVQTTLSSPSASVFGWSDSAIALAWLRQPPAKWQTFVANRVSEVQHTLPEARWNHVSYKDNPADCASRGLSAEELSSHPL